MHSWFAGPVPCPRPDLGMDMPYLTAAGPELLRFNLNRKYTSYFFGVGGNNVQEGAKNRNTTFIMGIAMLGADDAEGKPNFKRKPSHPTTN